MSNSHNKAQIHLVLIILQRKQVINCCTNVLLKSIGNGTSLAVQFKTLHLWTIILAVMIISLIHWLVSNRSIWFTPSANLLALFAPYYYVYILIIHRITFLEEMTPTADLWSYPELFSEFSIAQKRLQCLFEFVVDAGQILFWIALSRWIKLASSSFSSASVLEWQRRSI